MPFDGRAAEIRLEQKPPAIFCVKAVYDEAARSMPIAPHFDDPEYWHERAKEARRLAERMTDETAKGTVLSIAEECDEFAVTATILHFDKLLVRRLIHETKGS